jgi:hypothetical protein
MICYFKVAPMALLSGGCIARELGTPVMPYALYGDAPAVCYPAPSTAARAIERWQLPPTNGWAPFSKYTLLTSVDQNTRYLVPDVRGSTFVKRAECAGAAVGRSGLPEHTIWIVDLPGAASVAFGARLSQTARSPVAPVLTFNNWPADSEMIPAEEPLAALLSYEPRLASGDATPLFLLDRWRLAYREETPPDSVTDNRYALNPSDLPTADRLAAAGINRIIYVVGETRGNNEEDDLHSAFLDYQNAGLPLSMIGLDQLCASANQLPAGNPGSFQLAAQGWGPLLDRYTLRVVPRHTLLADIEFFRRSVGGFGGIHARPHGIFSGLYFSRGIHGGGG